MPQLLCEKVSKGMRPSEVTVTIRDFAGQTDFLRIEKDFLNEEHGQFHLPVAVVYKDCPKEAALIELPQESERGANRIWVKLSNLSESAVVPA
jgi:hypothetical protein